MPRHGIAGYLYELEIVDGKAYFHFVDPEDASNTADVTIAPEDFPKGTVDADSRPVADMAYLQVAKQLNDKRDERLKAAAAASFAADQSAKAQARDAAQEYMSSISSDPPANPGKKK